MRILNFLATNLSPIITRLTLGFWLKDPTVLADTAVELVDLLQGRVSDSLAARKASRELEDIGDRVVESLATLFEIERAEISEASRMLVAEKVHETLQTHEITAAFIAEADLNPVKLTKALLYLTPVEVEHFTEDEKHLYIQAIGEVCDHIIEISSKLPAFTEQTFAEILKRIPKQLPALLEEMIDRVRRIEEVSQKANPDRISVYFEQSYRENVRRKFDSLELFGIDDIQQHSLTLAYITLRANEHLPRNTNETSQTTANKDISEFSTKTFLEEEGKVSREAQFIDTILATSNRLLIQGLAGSGKTTLLHWVAVKTATQGFQNLAVEFTNWSGKIPFYIILRTYADKELPRPDKFVSEITPMIAGSMPPGWAHQQLIEGRAVLLIDGVDELSEKKRPAMFNWLRELITEYPLNKYIITSRPAAVDEKHWPEFQKWLMSENFRRASLQSMDLAQIYTFIDHWYNAAGESLAASARKGLQSLASNLKIVIENNISLRKLATSPLLCAMLCALFRKRRSHLPANRIDLYKAGCDLLLNRRDRERGIRLTEYPDIDDRQRRLLMQSVAYWFLKNGWTEVAEQQVDSFLEERLRQVNLPINIRGNSVRRLFVERTGLMREPVSGKIDFTHRTFQEFLAAREAIQQMDFGLLREKANDDHWRETIILAVGLARPVEQQKLIQQIVEDGNSNSKKKHRLHLLAVACLETAFDIDTKTRELVEDCMAKLPPPRDEGEAQAIASAGELAIQYLQINPRHKDFESAACLLALALIGGELAFSTIISYSKDHRAKVTNQLWAIWDYFDREQYSHHVLSEVATKSNKVKLTRASSLSGFEYLTPITELVITDCSQIKDLSTLATLTNLRVLKLGSCVRITDIRALSSLTNLEVLELQDCPLLKDISAIANLSKLNTLVLDNCEQLRDISVITHMPVLTGLRLRNCRSIANILAIGNAKELRILELSRGARINSIDPLSNLEKLLILNLSFCTEIRDIKPLSSLNSLKHLSLKGCFRIRDVAPLLELKRLLFVDFSGCPHIINYDVLAGLPKLRTIDPKNPLEGLSERFYDRK